MVTEFSFLCCSLYRRITNCLFFGQIQSVRPILTVLHRYRSYLAHFRFSPVQTRSPLVQLGRHNSRVVCLWDQHEACLTMSNLPKCRFHIFKMNRSVQNSLKIFGLLLAYVYFSSPVSIKFIFTNGFQFLVSVNFGHLAAFSPVMDSCDYSWNISILSSLSLFPWSNCSLVPGARLLLADRSRSQLAFRSGKMSFFPKHSGPKSELARLAGHQKLPKAYRTIELRMEFGCSTYIDESGAFVLTETDTFEFSLIVTRFLTRNKSFFPLLSAWSLALLSTSCSNFSTVHEYDFGVYSDLEYPGRYCMRTIPRFIWKIPLKTCSVTIVRRLTAFLLFSRREIGWAQVFRPARQISWLCN